MEQKKVADEQPDIEPAAQYKRPYEAPRILSEEALEVAAAICGPAGFYGKNVPLPCRTLGS